MIRPLLGLLAACVLGCGMGGEAERGRGGAAGAAGEPGAPATVPPVSVRDPEAGRGWPGVEASFVLDRAAAGDFRHCEIRTPALRDDGIGPIRAGATQAVVLDACADAYRAWDATEGFPRPVLIVRLGEILAQLTLADTLPDSPVRYMVVADALARTEAGLGPGSLLVDLVDAYGWPDLFEGQCVVFADFEPLPNLTWELRVPLDEGLDCTEIERAGWSNDPSLLPGSAYAERVIISGVPPGSVG